jgi:hypothetical protein
MIGSFDFQRVKIVTNCFYREFQINAVSRKKTLKIDELGLVGLKVK